MSTTIEIEGQSDLLTVRHVTAHGDARSIGRTLAEAAHLAHGDAARPRSADPAEERVRRRWLEIHHPALAARGRGVADYFEIDPDDMTVSLDVLGTLPTRAGCSVTVHPGAGTVNGHGLLGRNYDFGLTTLSEFVGRQPWPGERPMVADPWIVELHPSDGLASVTIGMGDVLGAMDGINSAGLAVALLADDVNPALEASGVLQVGLAESQVVRYLLDTCTTVGEAQDALRLAKHYYLGIPCHFMVADRTGAAFVWEHSRHRNREFVVEPDDRLAGRIVCTNHLLHRWPDASGLVDEGSVGTATKSFERWTTLNAAISSEQRVSATDVRDQLASVSFHDPAAQTRTIWSAVYDLHDSSVDVVFFRGDGHPSGPFSTPLCIELPPPRRAVDATANGARIPSRRALKVLAAAHIWANRVSRGRLGNKMQGHEVCFVTMTGAKTGRKITKPLMYVPHEDGVLLVASLGGGPKNPVWYSNLVAHPQIEVLHRGRSMRLVARLATRDEKPALWPICDDAFPPYAQYRTNTGRDIPIFVCEAVRR